MSKNTFKNTYITYYNPKAPYNRTGYTFWKLCSEYRGRAILTLLASPYVDSSSVSKMADTDPNICKMNGFLFSK